MSGTGNSRLLSTMRALLVAALTGALLLSSVAVASAETAAQSSAADRSAAGSTCPAPKVEPEPEYQAMFLGGHTLRADQVKTAVLIMSVGKAMGVGERGVRIALMSALHVSALTPWAVNDDYVGLFQQLYDPSTGLYGDYDRTDSVGASRMFYDQLLALAPKYAKDKRKDWQLAEIVQQTKEGKEFDAWRPTAVELMKKFWKTAKKYDLDPKPDPVCIEKASKTDPGSATGVPAAFDPGMIISDDVFYDSGAMTVDEIREFIATKGADCTGDECLRSIRPQAADQAADQYCDAYTASPDDDAAAIIAKVSVACHVNPQVMLVTLQKESGLLDRTDVSAASYDAAWGWHCPDTGPGGSANCDPQYAGFFAQAYGMAKQWSRYVVDPGKYHYQAGQTAEVLWNVAETGCGGTDVTIKNKATASLYNYTPYQPNEASLAAYPGTGDKCSSYGNRNFYFLFGQYFGKTGGVSVAVSGVAVTIPDDPSVPAALVGAKIQAPNEAVAKGLAAGLSALGTPYVWGGGTDGGPADEGCARGGGSLNSCQGTVGYDCSGLTAYVITQAGFSIGDNSSAQRSGGTDIAWSDGQPGDLVGWDGHIAIYLGIIDGVQYVLEAPEVGRTVSIRSMYGGHDAVMHRYWS
jgi:cell wall-associated NlpC family hydrolase